tara:strand:+ start:2291 stop:4021 length:1731 start_codon:yes stop_codon:yes gene_type:complete
MLTNLRITSILLLLAVVTGCATENKVMEQAEIEQEFQQPEEIIEPQPYELEDVKNPEKFVKYYLRSKIGIYNSNSLESIAQNHYRLALENPSNIKIQEEAFLLLLANKSYAKAITVSKNKDVADYLTFEQLFNFSQLLAQNETEQAHEVLKEILSEQQRLPYLKILNKYFDYYQHKNIERLSEEILAIKSSVALDGFKYYYIARAYEAAENYQEAFKLYEKAFLENSLRTETVFKRLVYTAKLVDAEELKKNLFRSNSKYGKDLYLVDQAFIDINELKPLNNDVKNVTSQIFYDLGWSINQAVSTNLAGLNFLALSDYIVPNAQAKFQIAKGYASNEWNPDAIELLKSIDKKSQYYWSAQIILIDIIKQDNPAKAIKLAKQLQATKRFNSHYIEGIIGQIYLNDDQFKKAIQSFTIAIQNDASPKLFFSRAVAYEKTNQIDLALDDLKTAYNLNPKNPIVLNYLGYLLIDLHKNPEQGLEYIEQAVRLDPTNPASLDSLGWAYLNLKEYDKGLALLEKAYALAPQDGVIAGHLADAYYKADRKKEAIIYWKKALELEKSDKREIKRIEKQLYKYNN